MKGGERREKEKERRSWKVKQGIRRRRRQLSIRR
jgi:hypothetical protein